MCCLRKRTVFAAEVKDPVWLHKAHRDGFFVDLITGMSNAAITVERSWIENARPAMILDVRARVLAAEELLVSKLFVVRRERFDGADIAHIVYATTGTSTGIGFSSWWMCTGRCCSLPWCSIATFIPPTVTMCRRGYGEKLLGSLLEELSNPDPSSEFRGSLVDDKMFAIDVAEWGMADFLPHHRKARIRKRPGSTCSFSVASHTAVKERN